MKYKLNKLLKDKGFNRKTIEVFREQQYRNAILYGTVPSSPLICDLKILSDTIVCIADSCIILN